jgi:chitin biosynthesis protein CHS5
MLSTKISGLAVDTEYSFHLVLRTTGGTYSSPVLKCRTHKMTDLSGITVTPGVLPEQLRTSLEIAVDRIGGRIADIVRIDTTHFVCTEGRGKEWERALEMNIPVVRPEWIEGCEREGRIVGVRGYYLDANPKQRQVGSNPLISKAAAGSSNVSIGAKGSQTNLPERRTAPPPPPPKSPDRESDVTGEDNGPRLEVPPTPPPKTETSTSPVSAEAAPASQVASSSISEEEREDKTPEEKSEKTPSPVKESAPHSQARRSEASMKAKVEDEREGEDSGSGDMDEVPF